VPVALYCAVVPENAAMPDIRETAVIDLLGMLAFAELLAFDRMAADARLAPDLHRRAVLSEMAAREIDNYRRLADRLAVLGVDPEDAMAPFVGPLQDYHGQTEPSDWYEGLAKAYVGDSVADDFTREVAGLLDGPDRELILEVLHDSRHADFAASELRAAIAADPKLANRLSMWSRRLVGEGLSQALRVAADRPALAALMVAGPSGTSGPAGAAAALFKRLTAAHTARMTAAGLNN
jgi:hypothetical protein